jgi:DNA-directed RNA polymerase III subunit RPC8
VRDELNKKLANKVVFGLGLCLALYDILEIGESFVFPGDSATHTKVDK